MQFFYDYIILIPVVAYVIVAALKGIYYLVRGEFSLGKVLWTWGMPSGHAAFVASLATAVGIKHGIENDLFAVSLVFAAIIIYDAMNIRFQSGLHAKAINEIKKGKSKFNESLWHLPSEAIAGSILGVIIAGILMQF